MALWYRLSIVSQSFDQMAFGKGIKVELNAFER